MLLRGLGGVGHPYLEEAQLGLTGVMLLIHITPSLSPSHLGPFHSKSEWGGSMGQKELELPKGMATEPSVPWLHIPLGADAQPGLQPGPARSESSPKHPLILLMP